jgi:hypothetical protein
MRWLLMTVVFVLASSAAAWADEALPARPLDLAPVTLPTPQPINFDLLDLRGEEREARTPPRADSEPHSIFVIKQHLGIAGGYDNGSAHASIGFYITVPGIEIGVGRYPAYDPRLNQSFMKDEVAFFVSMASAHYRAGYIKPWGLHWYVNLEQVFDVHASRAGSQLGVSFSRK